MTDLLQKLSGTRTQPTQQGTLCDLADDSGARVFNVLGSETARRIYLHLQNETATASEIAEDADTSIQNAQYHLTKLREVELVEVADIEYSSKGSEMNIYAATDDPLIIVSGSESRLEKVRVRLSDLLGGIALLLGEVYWWSGSHGKTYLESGLHRLDFSALQVRQAHQQNLSRGSGCHRGSSFSLVGSLPCLACWYGAHCSQNRSLRLSEFVL